MKRIIALLMIITMIPIAAVGESGAGKAYAVGDSVTFGRYYTRMDGELHPIEWFVLKVEDDAVTLLSRYALDSQPLNETGGGATVKWDNCSMREWLNGTFYETAFSDGERQHMQETGTKEMVTLPTILSVRPYLKDALICEPTEYARIFCRVKTENGKCEWWTREFTPVPMDGRAVIPGTDGKEVAHGLKDKYIGVRPMIRVNPKTAALGNPSDEVPDETPAEPADNPVKALPSVGDIVTFGRYETKDSHTLSPVEWYVIEVSREAVVLASVYVLDNQPWCTQDQLYGVLFGETVEWNNSYLRNWLNGIFVADAFNAEEKKMLMSMTLKNEDRSSVTDRVLLLSSAEASSIFRDLRCAPTAFLKSKSSSENPPDYYWWWTRTEGPMPGQARCFGSDGSSKITDVTDSLGVRPVIAVNTEWFK